MATRKTEEELAAEAAAAEAEAKERAEREAAEAEAEAQAEREAEEAREKAIKEREQAAARAEQERVSGIYAAAPAGYEAARDEAIKSGSSVASFKALIEAAKRDVAKMRAEAIDEDTDANAAVKPSTGKDAPTGDDAAVKAILGSFKLATGEK